MTIVRVGDVEVECDVGSHAARDIPREAACNVKDATVDGKTTDARRTHLALLVPVVRLVVPEALLVDLRDVVGDGVGRRILPSTAETRTY